MKAKMSKVYIDGENFVHELLRVLMEDGVIQQRAELKKFDARFLLSEALLGQTLPQEIVYYTTKLKKVAEPSYLQRLSEKIANWNARWTPWLISQGMQVVKAGTLKKRDSHRCRSCGQADQILQEKGVDVRLATDMVFDAATNRLDTIFLLSSDSDLIPAINKARECGARVVYIAPAKRSNRAIIAVADEIKVYDSKLILESYKRVNNGQA